MKKYWIASLLAFLPFYGFAEQTKAFISSLDQCYQQIGDQARTKLAACLRQQLQQADKILQVSDAKVRQGYLKTDSTNKKQAIAALDRSVAAFKHFRDKECQRVGDAAMGGSGAGDFQLACQVDLTRWRIIWLKNNP